MYLVIDYSFPGQVALFYYHPGHRLEVRFPVTDSTGLLLRLVQFLIEEAIPVNRLRAIGVVQGVGSWTAARVATTIGNTLGLAWGIPVIPLISAEEPGWLGQLEAASPGSYVLPAYTGELRLKNS